MKNAELLLPVGNISMALAAIHNGANAIYVGMPGFNARGRSYDHSFSELEEIIQTCHLYNVHVHVAFNILIFQDELAEAKKQLLKVLALHPDAIIIQDIGLIRLVNQIAPNQVVHGSTQMTVTNHDAMELLSDLNIKRFVLGRENSIAEIEKIRANTDKELEVFVHGALCVAYSGQCFTSEAIGGRSANRGQCAQSCRLDYELYVDGEKKELVGQDYLVSPKDLCGINEVPKLIELGVESFKVEGRLKGPEYVSSVASAYSSVINNKPNFNLDKSIFEMELAYSRGFYPGWLNGVAHQELVTANFSSNRGKYIGQIKEVRDRTIIIQTSFSLLNGDGILIASPDASLELGGKIYSVKEIKNGSEISLSNDFDYKKLRVGQEVYLTARDSVYKELNKSYKQKELQKKIPINIKISGKLGEPIQLVAIEGDTEISLISDTVLETAQTQGLTKESAFEELSGLSSSVYKISNFNFKVEGNVFFHKKSLRELKQKMIESLNLSRLSRKQFQVETSLEINEKPSKPIVQSKINILLRKIEQIRYLEKFIKMNVQYKKNIGQVIIDFEFGKDFTVAVNLVKAMGIESTIATTRILKPGEYHNFKQIERANPDSILIRNLGALNYFNSKEFNLYGDFSLNVTNSLSFEYLTNKKLKTICASYDMNAVQLNSFLKYVDSSKVEITAHQYMPEFHMEHCVFAAFLSKGNSFKDCGKPCEKHDVYLKDMYGNQHEIKADQECRNTMFKSTSQSALTLIPDWQKRGVSSFRFEALNETEDELIPKLELYLKVINNELNNDEAFNKLGKLESYGLSTGQLLKSNKKKGTSKSF